MHRISLQVDEKHTVLGSRYRSGAYVPRFGPERGLCVSGERHVTLSSCHPAFLFRRFKEPPYSTVYDPL
jgi:hypothetical protein